MEESPFMERCINPTALPTPLDGGELDANMPAVTRFLGCRHRLCVAVQVVNLQKHILKPVFQCIGSRVETRRLSSYYVSTAFDLYTAQPCVPPPPSPEGRTPRRPTAVARVPPPPPPRESTRRSSAVPRVAVQVAFGKHKNNVNQNIIFQVQE
jgi:hypothetical protein